MSTVDSIALWIGLISSIVGIVLSILAIIFTVHVDRFSREVSAQTIKSLQKIESDVDRVSADTRELIKAGWDKMLGVVQPSSSSSLVEGSAKEIASGIASELKEEFKVLIENTGTIDQKNVEVRLSQVLDKIQEALDVQIRTEATPNRPGALVDQARMMIESTSGLAKALVIAIAPRHITRKEYLNLLKGNLSKQVGELRKVGILVPLLGMDSNGKEIPVYYFPSRFSAPLRAALSLVDLPSDSDMDLVKSELDRIGYPDQS